MADKLNVPKHSHCNENIKRDNTRPTNKTKSKKAAASNISSENIAPPSEDSKDACCVGLESAKQRAETMPFRYSDGYSSGAEVDIAWLQKLIKAESTKYTNIIQLYKRRELKSIFPDYDDEMLKEICDDLNDGQELHLNAGLVDDRIEQLNRLNVTNAKSYLTLAMPMESVTTLKDDPGSVLGKITLRIDKDQLSREKQYESLRMLFGEGDAKIGPKMLFSKTISVYKEAELLHQITNFLVRCNKPDSEWACVQAVIILNGHGSRKGTIALGQDNPMPFQKVVDHIDRQMRQIHGNGKMGTFPLPLGVVVLNGLCFAHEAGPYALNPLNTNIKVRVFTSDTNKITTTDISNMGFTAKHVQLEQYAREQYWEAVGGDIMKDTVSSCTTDEQIQKYEETMGKDEEDTDKLTNPQLDNVPSDYDMSKLPLREPRWQTKTSTPAHSQSEIFLHQEYSSYKDTGNPNPLHHMQKYSDISTTQSATIAQESAPTFPDESYINVSSIPSFSVRQELQNVTKELDDLIKELNL